MTREPKIPMSPTELPQQRIHEVVGLPERPKPFNCLAGYGVVPKDVLPEGDPPSPTYLAQVEWAWTPSHNRLDAYYLDKRRSHWVLWSRYWNFDQSDLNWMPVACVGRKGVNQRQAAVHLLIEFWKFDAEENKLDEYHWINEDGYLSVADLEAIARYVWDEAE